MTEFVDKTEQFGSKIDQETPKTVLEYLKTKHETIKNSYSTPDGYGEGCEHVAAEVANLFLKTGIRPYIMLITENVYDHGFRTERIEPLLYGGRESWGTHQICCWNDQVFDPIIGKPVDISEYCKIAFGKDFKMTVKNPAEKITDFVKSWSKLIKIG